MDKTFDINEIPKRLTTMFNNAANAYPFLHQNEPILYLLDNPKVILKNTDPKVVVILPLIV